ncbi:MAG: hypothetical protein ACLRWQ_12235 [Flavonifractor plautii]
MELIEILQALNACHGPSGSEGAVAGVPAPWPPPTWIPVPQTPWAT